MSSARFTIHLNPTAYRKAKIIYNFDLSECNRVKPKSFVGLIPTVNLSCLKVDVLMMTIFVHFFLSFSV